MKEQNAKSTETSIDIQKVQEELEHIMNNVKDTKLPQRAYHILRLAIRDLKLMPGKTILEREIADVLEMSRTPVREALVRLQTEGVVRLIPRKGFIVEPIEKEDLRETYEVVEELEGLAAKLATDKIGEQELNELDSLIDCQEQAIKENNLTEWARLDDLFHFKIINYADNKRLSNVIEVHADQLFRARLFTINKRPLPFRSIVEHQAIIACMRANDGEAAQVSMQSHRKRARNEILKVL
ncbi:DNA-binding GntR family transcriptional regulator [Scopulibacillus darangshiensis]|uniref:DNA-binding GntR family transcriptional regulator n=1 Tax=Scopulibacillus darangshiensis TaxID=442528 RepID=A0A4R2NUB6_9BACL|nr:GntR family transcriptional regulator [Scopulibacillus darangshiensis]TCP25580.1 DNA-binding GntR family transcriptional regulator [Scopulibacillus darangshiensis]